MRKAIAILWPSFIFGGIGAVVFFSLHDPVDLSFVGPNGKWTRLSPVC